MLRTRTAAVVGRVPPALRQPLARGVEALVEERPTCLPTVAPASTTPVQRPPARKEHGRGHKGHGHGKGHDD